MNQSMARSLPLPLDSAVLQVAAGGEIDKTRIFHGGTIITMDDTHPEVEAIAIVGSLIAARGSLALLKSRFEQAEVIDLNGRVMLPGFIDAHSHILWAAKTRGAPVVDVRAETVPTYKALLAKVRRRVVAAKPGEHLLFFGLDAQLHPDMEQPTREQLDEIAPDNPLGIQTSNCHALFMNSAGFEACGIDESFETPPGSIVERDAKGRPTGKIEEAITWQALEVFYQSWGDERLSDEFRGSISQFIDNGITTVTEHLYMPFYKSYYLAALKQGLPMPRVAAYQQATASNMQVEDMSIGDDRLWMAGIKIHADGSPFIGNIWLTQPYLETEITLERMHLKPGHTGSMNYRPDYFNDMLSSYYKQGWQLSVHTQGDGTIDMVLDFMETLVSEDPTKDHRFRLEHCALMRQDQIERAVKLGVVSSFFINHITHWGAPIEDALFGSERAAHYMPAGSAKKAGMIISLHADTPMTDPSALELMQAATTRVAGDGRVLGQSECMAVADALRAVTIDAAWQINKEDKLGSLEEGKYADLVILAENPLEVKLEELRSIEVCETWLAGERVK